MLRLRMINQRSDMYFSNIIYNIGKHDIRFRFYLFTKWRNVFIIADTICYKFILIGQYVII